MIKCSLFYTFLLIINALPSIAQVNFTSSNSPIFIINANSTIIDEPKVKASLKVIYKDNGQRNYLADSVTDYNGRIGIKLHGQSSQAVFYKKSYGFET
jgi:hypothetical protein